MAHQSLLRAAATLLAGLLFGIGLTYAGMTRPETVLDFLNFRDLGLLLVLGAAVSVNLLVFQLWPRLRPTPLLGGSYQQRPFRVDRRSLAGGVLFGLGWGICGVCPGPALAGSGAGDMSLLLALAGIVLGAGLHGWWAGRR
ncbi:DUF6691 family protein [Vogesella oryzae]|uniref:DUF6691 family protein n=1 Tax=Vogesella oryzae TaxID=1735285 RepID=UPI001582F120|nr:DUF6691 family protein [Vogesella oryzae]